MDQLFLVPLFGVSMPLVSLSILNICLFFLFFFFSGSSRHWVPKVFYYGDSFFLESCNGFGHGFSFDLPFDLFLLKI